MSEKHIILSDGNDNLYPKAWSTQGGTIRGESLRISYVADNSGDTDLHNYFLGRNTSSSSNGNELKMTVANNSYSSSNYAVIRVNPNGIGFISNNKSVYTTVNNNDISVKATEGNIIATTNEGDISTNAYNMTSGNIPGTSTVFLNNTTSKIVTRDTSTNITTLSANTLSATNQLIVAKQTTLSLLDSSITLSSSVTSSGGVSSQASLSIGGNDITVDAKQITVNQPEIKINKSMSFKCWSNTSSSYINYNSGTTTNFQAGSNLSILGNLNIKRVLTGTKTFTVKDSGIQTPKLVTTISINDVLPDNIPPTSDAATTFSNYKVFTSTKTPMGIGSVNTVPSVIYSSSLGNSLISIHYVSNGVIDSTVTVDYMVIFVGYNN